MTHLKHFKTKALLKHLKVALKSKTAKTVRKVLAVVLKILGRILLKRLLEALLDGTLPGMGEWIARFKNCRSSKYQARSMCRA